ncbi:MAG: hypothetical protein GY751_23845 [Bacteroidetes bacterium]|nr:hypothetical protein [Bacteroidota bacterium]
MSIEGERILSKMVPSVEIIKGEEETVMVQFPGEGWKEIIADSVYQWNDELDLSGISAEHLTAFFTGMSLQEPNPFWGLTVVPPIPPAVTATNGAYIIVTDTISNVPFDASNVAGAEWEGVAPGFIGSRTNWDDVIMGSWREYVSNNTLHGAVGVLQLNQNGSFGSAEATASRKLYFSRIIRIILNAAGDYVVIPACRFVAGSIIAEEKDYAYLMRLKRSSHNEQ